MSRAGYACSARQLGWPVLVACLTVGTPVAAGLDGVSSIGVFTVIEKGDALAPDVSVFLAGYLDNVKNYRAYNLDQYYVETEAEAVDKAAELGADAVLAATVKGFGEYENENRAEAELRLFETGSGEKLASWKAQLRAPYFDPPSYTNLEPYGNLDEAFVDIPVKTYPTSTTIRLLVLTDQRLRGPGKRTKEYLQSQLDLTARVLAREFGIALEVVRIKRWSAPEAGIFTIAEAAAAVPGRDKVDMTFVCVGPPAPATSWRGVSAIGYARVLTNIVVNRVMNAHGFVHEIAHVLGAIHVDQEACIMEPMIRTYRLAERFKVLHPILFSQINRDIIDLTRSIPLGAGYEQHQDKIASLLQVYEGLRPTRLKDIAPYYGDLLLALGRGDEAIEVLTAAQQAAPTDISVRYLLGKALTEAGRFAEAQKLVQEDFDLQKSSVSEMTDRVLSLKDFAAIKITPSFLAFDETAVGSIDRRALRVANLGTENLELSRIAVLAAPFFLAEGAPKRALIEPGKTLELEIEFRPAARGAHRATLEIESNARGDVFKEVRLSGQAGE